MADLDELARRFLVSGTDHESRSPFYASLNRRIADEPAIVELLQAAPEQQQLPVLLLAAVHSIVLAEGDSELAQWYPTAVPDPLATDPFPAFRRLCRDRGDEIRSMLATRVVQTNEIGRCALFLPPLGLVANEVGALSLVDVGASAGLNLQLDRISYRYEPGGRVGPTSPVSIVTGTRGPVPVPGDVPAIAARVGLDQRPIDLSDPNEARWLMACVWPDQPDRFERLRGALELASRHPVLIMEGDAVDSMEPLVRRAARQGHPVVLNSWVLNYLDPPRRRDYVERIDRIGAGCDLTWVFAESPGLCPELPFPVEVAGEHITVLMMVRWRHGLRAVELLGRAHPHGYWLHWIDRNPGR